MSVVYTVQPVSPDEHLFRVECRLTTPDPAGQLFRLPSWIRGSYLVRDFSKHVVDLQASCDGQPITIQRLDKRSFRCMPCSGVLTLRYHVYAFDLSVRKAYLDRSRGFFNGSSLFYRAIGAEDGGYEIHLERGQAEACADWAVATAMSPEAVDEAGFGRYHAEDYETLIDHPVELGCFERLRFEVDGIDHQLVLSGHFTLDRARVVTDLQRICTVEREMFGCEPPLPSYLFLTNVVGKGYGGLEHRASTALICSRKDLPMPGAAVRSEDYVGFLGLCSHEYFHLWNVKRITPQAFAESDLGAEAYTRDLWHYEGVTSYYDDLFLRRAELIDAGTYLDLVAKTATRVERGPGHAVQTLADSSFEAWTKFYQPDENTPNQVVSYYAKGALVALCLDLLLRRDSAITLDDVMREAWALWGRTGEPVPEGGLEQLAKSCSGLDLSEFFDLALRSTAPLPMAELLAAFGVRAWKRPPYGAMDAGGRSKGSALRISLGLSLKAGTTTVAQVLCGAPAVAAGVHAGDQLLALDCERVTASSWPAMVAALQAGCAVPLHVFRDERLLCLSVVPAPPADNTWTLQLDDEADAAALRLRHAWLGV